MTNPCLSLPELHKNNNISSLLYPVVQNGHFCIILYSVCSLYSISIHYLSKALYCSHIYHQWDYDLWMLTTEKNEIFYQSYIYYHENVWDIQMFVYDQNKSFPSFALKASSSLQFLEAEMYKSWDRGTRAEPDIVAVFISVIIVPCLVSQQKNLQYLGAHK